MEDDGGADIHLQPVEDPTPEQVDIQRRLRLHGKPVLEQAPGRTCGERSPHWSRFAGRTCDLMDPRWSSLFLKVCTPWKGPTLEQFMKNCSPWEGLTLEKLVEDCLPWEGPYAGAGKSVRSPPPEEEGAAETTYDELTTTPIPHLPVPLWGRR
ncbi:zinc finger and BTB domain-containing protein 5 [Grus japonensis]|uniref:Zinc finger and BTB domain-containing protein 5 n=1 Tax=Grus japonensis TaxID=30415 RepID=A0ABC9WJ25_GRUJA